MSINLNNMVTESSNSNTKNIDTLSTIEVLKAINNEDKKVAFAVEQALNDIEKATTATINAFAKNGRLIYIGAGTSGRLGILDASECPPTYGTKPEQVVGLIAGGKKAILAPVENAEDSKDLAIEDLKNINLSKNDVLVGIAASGRTPYVISAIEYANKVGATSVALSCNPKSEIAELANIAISVVVGGEVVTGSSRMKAGTAQKLVLNMITTTAMIKRGKVFGNLMVDVEATNSKLKQRQINIVQEATGCTKQEALNALTQTDRHCKTAIFMLLAKLNASEAKQILEKHDGFIRKALEEIYNKTQG